MNAIDTIQAILNALGDTESKAAEFVRETGRTPEEVLDALQKNLSDLPAQLQKKPDVRLVAFDTGPYPTEGRDGDQILVLDMEGVLVARVYT